MLEVNGVDGGVYDGGLVVLVIGLLFVVLVVSMVTVEVMSVAIQVGEHYER
jgi:hypothetical protein